MRAAWKVKVPVLTHAGQRYCIRKVERRGDTGSLLLGVEFVMVSLGKLRSNESEIRKSIDLSSNTRTLHVTNMIGSI